MIRTGFVSNSSTSSFLVGYRGDREEVIAGAGYLADFMRSVLAEIDRLKREYKWHDSPESLANEMMSEWYDEVTEDEQEELEYWVKKIRDAFPEPGWTITYGWASYNEGSGIEQMIGNASFGVDSEMFRLVDA